MVLTSQRFIRVGAMIGTICGGVVGALLAVASTQPSLLLLGLLGAGTGWCSWCIGVIAEIDDLADEDRRWEVMVREPHAPVSAQP